MKLIINKARNVIDFGPLHEDPSHSPEAGPGSLVAETSRGRVLHCEGCGRLHVRFGNAVWVRDPDALRNFRESLERQTAEIMVVGGCGTGELYITFGTGNGYRFDREELEELRFLLRRACAAVDGGETA